MVQVGGLHLEVGASGLLALKVGGSGLTDALEVFLFSLCQHHYGIP